VAVIEAVREHPRHFAALAVFVLVAYVLFATARDPGLTWDEAIYMQYGLNYARWFSGELGPRLDPVTLDRAWFAGQAHPPLGKLITMASMMGLHRYLGPIWAARVGAAACFAVLAGILFLFMQKRFGSTAALFTAIFLLVMPRLFAHAHLASLEVPLLLMWTLTVIAFEKGTRSVLWAVFCGVFFGLALLTKFNAIFLLAILIPWGLLFHGRRALSNFISMAFIGPLVFFLGWPALWVNTWQHLAWYVGDKFGRMPIPVYYLGTAYNPPPAPWHYPLVLCLVTVPVLILVAAGAGVFRMARGFGGNESPVLEKTGKNEKNKVRDQGTQAPTSADERQATAFLLIFGFAITVLCAALPLVPRYDGVRLFVPAFPFLACLAGIGASWIWETMATRGRPNVACTVFVVLLVLQVVPLVMLHPFQMSYYNELVGGPWGAKALGFETTYWGEGFTARAASFVADRIPAGGKVALVAVGSFVPKWYQVEGVLPETVDIVDFAGGNWDAAVVVPREGWIRKQLSAEERDLLRSLQKRQADYVDYLSPVRTIPVCEIYLRTEDGTPNTRPEGARSRPTF